MAIRFKCLSCGATGNAKDDLAGRIVECPKCKGLMEIPASEISQPPVPPAPNPKETTPKHRPRVVRTRTLRFSVLSLLLFTAAIAASITFLGTLWDEWALPHYTAMLMLMAIGSYAVLGKAGLRGRAWARWTAFAICFGTLALYVRNDCYVRRWDAKVQGNKTWYSDWRHRWSGRLYLRRLHSITDNGTWYASGGFSESGKMHGHWEHSVLSPDDPTVWEFRGYKGSKYMLARDVWYWYGEEITEGEWHLRNK